MKRSFGRLQDAGITDMSAGISKQHAGQQLWNLLVLEYAGKQLTAALLCKIAHWATLAGATGVAELAIDPKWADKNGSRHAKLVLGRHYELPDLYFTEAPMYEKKDCHRSISKIPMQLPSMIFRKEYENFVEPPENLEPDSSLSSFDCPKYRNHPALGLAERTGIIRP